LLFGKAIPKCPESFATFSEIFSVEIEIFGISRALGIVTYTSGASISV
jgi:hypothetical protein